MADPSRSAGTNPHRTPRWVRVSGIIAIVLALVAVVVFLIGGGPGGHGPGRHLPGGEPQFQQEAPGSDISGRHAPPPGVEHRPENAG